MSELILKPKEDVRIRAGHLWIFSNEVARVDGLKENGDIVDVIGSRNRFLGHAGYNRHTLIAARLLSRRREEIDVHFFVRRFRQAKIWREKAFGRMRSFRIVYSEGDLLPGLIVDKYEDYLVVQLLTLGMERLRAPLLTALDSALNPAGVLLRGDSRFRELEGLPRETPTVVHGVIPENVIIEEAGARFAVDLLRGQKTGFYFDQRDTRAVARSLAGGRRVLDCFCYTGGFAINCALGGASQVLAIDNSVSALDMLKENVRLNGVAPIVTAQHGECFEVLRELDSRHERFDLIILDPPAFIKTKSQLRAGLSGYREINRMAMRLLSPEGVLLTCSCSQNLSLEQFKKMLLQAARGAKRYFRISHFLTQAADHPILQAMPETQYLKGLILQAL